LVAVAWSLIEDGEQALTHRHGGLSEAGSAFCFSVYSY
jgi:hypothetical protein